jgi:glycosyltransferase involved in cell wall biosynthesis
MTKRKKYIDAKQKNNRLKKILKTTATDLNKATPLISVCMIVKDEEQFLDNCLQSVKDIADEIIIIDTGSKDNTVNIARKYTDKIYFHPWKDSFSEARNHYFDYAKGDWIFQIDADEELVKDDIPVLLDAIKNPNIDTIMVPIISQLSRGQNKAMHNVERVFRNNGIIHYEGRIHNRVVGCKNVKIYPIHFLHYGYDLNDQDLSETKHKRRISLLKMDIEDDPENPLPYHYLSCCYLSRNLLHESLDVSLKALELAEKKNDRNSAFLWTRFNAAMAYYKLRDFRNAESMALSAISLDEFHLDSYFILTTIYFDQSRWTEVIKFGKLYLILIKKIKNNPVLFGTKIANSFNEAWKVLGWMGIAYHETGDKINAEDTFLSAISDTSNTSNLFKALKGIGGYYYNKALFPQAREYLEKAFDINREDTDVNGMLKNIGIDKQDKQTISCCMIVKNEEQFLEKCLKSVSDYVDEIIIVDTGSSDITVEIAKRFTDKVYFHPWENSFSKARNQALQYATGDWIFQIDADEELMTGSGPNVRLTIRDAKESDIVYVKIYSSYANGTKKSFHNFERLFRNNGKIRYEGSVHNQVVGGTRAFYSPIALWHYGYDVDEKKAEEKFERTTGLLKKEIEKDPDNPMHHHNLSVSYFSKQMNEEAISEAIKAIELSDSQKNSSNLYGWSHFIASMGYYRLGRLEEAKNYAKKSLNTNPEHMDSNFMLTIIAFDEGRWDDVVRYGNAYLELLEFVENKKGNVILENSMNEGGVISTLIGHAYYVSGSLPEMEAYYKRALDKADKKWVAWGKIGTYHMDKSGDLNLAEDFLTRALKESPDEHDVWYMLAKLNRKRGFIKEEMDCLEKIIRIGTTDSYIHNRLLSLYIMEGMADKAMDIILNHDNKIKLAGPMLCKLAVVYIEKNLVESAIKCYMMALEKDTSLFEAWASLGEIMLNMNKMEDSRMFLQKALSIKHNDVGTIVNLCDIASRDGDLLSIVNYCDLLLKVLKLPNSRTLNNFDDLKVLLDEISSALEENAYHQNQLSAISDRLPQMQDPPDQQSTVGQVV